jgi:predicted DNA repair protein MutK
MAGGLAALLDDIAAIAKAAASSIDDVSAAAGRASAKAAGVVVDDAAVTPRYVHGFEPSRELPVIKRIALGSLRNKLLIILPVAMLLSQVADWLLTPILMAGGAYLCFEGAEKLREKVSGHEPAAKTPVVEQGPQQEKKMIAGAIRTDLILSAEIMVIALDDVASEPFFSRLLIMVVVGVLITVAVYGAVGIIVKMDDVGLHIARTRTGGVARFGERLVAAMPKVLALLSTVGMAAMLWVGGHILLVGLDELGWHWPYETVHHGEVAVADFFPVLGGLFGWLTNTLASALLGIVVGGFVVAVTHTFHDGGHADDDHSGRRRG